MSQDASIDNGQRPMPGVSGKYAPGSANRRYLTGFVLASMAIASVWGSCSILIPNQIQMLETAHWFTGQDAGVNIQHLTLLQQQISAGAATATAAQLRLLAILNHFNMSKASSLAIVTAIGVAVTMILQPLIGVVSDRTRSRLGRRAPWILFGALAGAATLAVLSFAPSVFMVGLLYTIAQLLINVAMAPVNATVADRVQVSHRGTASSLGGFGGFFGLIGGAVFAGAMFGHLGLAIYAIAAAFVAVACVVFVFAAPDTSSKNLVVETFNWKEFLLGFSVALRSRDFRWVWIARVFLTFGMSVSTTLGIYMMQSYIHPALSVAEATALAPKLYLAAAPLSILSTVFVGRLSDWLGRRKPFVIAASLLLALSFLIPIVSPTLPALFIQAAIAGLAYGIYLPVDQALFIDVLPDAKSAGRDLGVAQLGFNLGQAIGPIAAGIVVGMTGGYLGVWVTGVVVVTLATVAILPVRVR
ncbi:MAG TPA: MFS transporter [Rhizomicrobium sp.]|jgi:MFS family permease